MPPDLVECTVEKVAINAVMAGCQPEYLPVVLAAVEAACTDEFNMHGLLATTMPSGPVMIVNGPIRRAIGMNSGINALGQGNRANATIGRALQLVVRNVGGGRPGGVDRATLGKPGKLAFCFAEDEEGSPWEPLSRRPRLRAGTSTVTLFPGEGPRGVVDQLSRDPESLARSFAACLRTVHHPKLPLAFDAILVVGPEHARVFREGGLDKARLHDAAARTAAAARRRRASCAAPAASPKACPTALRDAHAAEVPARRHRCIVHAGGGAGLFSAIIGGWANGDDGSQPVTGRSATHDDDRTRARSDRRADARRPRALARPAIARRHARRPARHLQAARQRVPRPARGAARRPRRRASQRFAKPTFTKPAPIDLRHEIAHQVRRGDRGARRLRVVHVVQCARHRRSGSPRHAGRVRRVDRVRRRGRGAGAALGVRVGRACSSRTRSRTAPTTRCGRSPTPPSTRSSRAVTSRAG